MVKPFVFRQEKSTRLLVLTDFPFSIWYFLIISFLSFSRKISPAPLVASYMKISKSALIRGYMAAMQSGSPASARQTTQSPPQSSFGSISCLQIAQVLILLPVGYIFLSHESPLLGHRIQI